MRGGNVRSSRYRVALQALLLAGVTATSLLAQPAAATPLTLVADGRSVQASWIDYIGGGNDIAWPSSPFAPFDFHGETGGVTASQNTSVTENAMGGSLAYTGFADPPCCRFAVGGSFFDITFDADVAASYTWTSSALGSVSASLVDTTTNTLVFETSSPGFFSDSGFLTAGDRYRLILEAEAVQVGSSGWDFSFSVVPEPSTLSLTGLGLLVVARRRWRRA